MPHRHPKSILITGATSAIGSALALAYATPGITLHLHGRNTQKLETVASQCRDYGARVTQCSFDIRDSGALRDWVSDSGTTGPLDVVISNAGMNTNIGSNGDGERWEDSAALMDINLRATMVLVDAALPAMRQRGQGQIALLSSLAGYFGLPVTPSYCASKAAIKAYGEALRGWLAPQGVAVNVIMPGYVDSAMCRAMPGPKPFLWTPERAARLIKRQLAANRGRISFPFPLNFGTWWLAVLPEAISQRIVRGMGYHG